LEEEKSMPRKPSDIVQFKVRIREKLRRRIEEAAKKNRISTNAEMASRLQASFDREDLAQTVEKSVQKTVQLFAEPLSAGKPQFTAPDLTETSELRAKLIAASESLAAAIAILDRDEAVLDRSES
jgi:hypothetical protein